MNTNLTMISHFNGIGLFPFAAAQAGIITIATTEIDPFCNAISRQWFPHATQYTDIRTAQALPYATIICGGDPCQPHSSAGKRAGAEDVRFLWPEMLRSIDEGRPTWVVNENVIGSVRNGVYDGKKADLEALGYACQGFDIPSGAVGGASRRRRIILVAHADGLGQSPQHLRRSRASAQMLPHRTPDAVGPADRDASASALLRMADGRAAGLDSFERRRRIKALGNAIDPQVFIPIFKAIAAVEAQLICA